MEINPMRQGKASAVSADIEESVNSVVSSDDDEVEPMPVATSAIPQEGRLGRGSTTGGLELPDMSRTPTQSKSLSDLRLVRDVYDAASSVRVNSDDDATPLSRGTGLGGSDEFETGGEPTQ